MRLKIVVSGSHGFVGKNLVSTLAKDDDIEIIPFERKKIKHKDYVVRILEEADALVHLAGLTDGAKQELMEANVGLTKALLEYFKKLKKKPKFIFASTFAVYAVSKNKLKESSPLKPRNFYGESKLEGERRVQKYARKYNFPAIILRFANIYGSGMSASTHSAISTFLLKAKKGAPLTVDYDGSQKRDFVYIADLIEAIKKAILWRGEDGEVVVVNISSGKGVSVNRLVGEIERIVGRKIRVIYPNKGAKEKGCWIGENSRAKRLLRWSPRTSLEKGLILTYKSLIG